MGLVSYCGEGNADALNMVEIIFKQPTVGERTRGYFSIRQELPREEVDNYDKRMRTLTSKLKLCIIKK